LLYTQFLSGARKRSRPRHGEEEAKIVPVNAVFFTAHVNTPTGFDEYVLVAEVCAYDGMVVGI
jgi:hypothetical protein